MSKKVYLTKEAILGANDVEVREVEVPEWGGIVGVRGMTGRERQKYEESLQGKKGQINTRYALEKLVALCVVDKDGNRLFSDDDIAALSKKSARALMRVAKVATELSGLTKEDMEEMVENFDETLFDD